jgi:demethylmenaquinone methyltransferase/2-methoxy-6-polyprenyl-1,4-benzoquinol methylase
MIKGIRKFYTEISGSYELINSLLTLGLDSRWRKKTAAKALESIARPGLFLDVCSGTGQTAALLGRRLNAVSPAGSPQHPHIIAADFSPQMLEKAVERMNRLGFKRIGFSFTLTDAIDLPFKNDSVDIITISFATRNLHAAPGHLLKAFREFHRVLKPGGCFLNLETSQPPGKIIRALFHLYVKLTVAPLGRVISGSKSSYNYLSNSIRSFYAANELSEILKEAGFAAVAWQSMLFGAVALHRAVKGVAPPTYYGPTGHPTAH